MVQSVTKSVCKRGNNHASGLWVPASLSSLYCLLSCSNKHPYVLGKSQRGLPRSLSAQPRTLLAASRAERTFPQFSKRQPWAKRKSCHVTSLFCVSSLSPPAPGRKRMRRAGAAFLFIFLVACIPISCTAHSGASAGSWF